MSLALMFLLLAATPMYPLNDFVNGHCPPPKMDGKSNADMKEQIGKNVDCLKKAMDKELDKFLVPLRAKDKDLFKHWMKLQAEYDRWAKESCETAEELHWVKMDTRRFDSGTLFGTSKMGCLAGAWGERAYFAHLLSVGDIEPFTTMVDGRKGRAEASKAVWAKALKDAKTLPGKTTAKDAVGKPDQKRWDSLVASLEGLGSATDDLVKAQCEAMPKPMDRCAERMSAWLYSLINPPPAP